MKKIKIYLDTSFLSHLHQLDAPEKMDDTLALWEDIMAGEYHTVISELTEQELMDCSEPKRTLMAKYLTQANFETLLVTQEAHDLAQEIIKRGILTAKSLDDCTHIAVAMLNHCDMIVSWNFKHLVNYRTIDGVREITVSKRYEPIDIYSPSMLLKGENSMEKPIISPDFTVEDIHKIREYNYEMTKSMTFEERRAYIRRGSQAFNRYKEDLSQREKELVTAVS